MSEKREVLIRTHSDYTVGWVCALSKELTAATAMLNHIHLDLPKPPNDPNTYTLGTIGKHNIAIACLPDGEIGTNSAATIATWLISTFPSIRFGLMVGIGGGIPPKVRLGDIVVSTPTAQYGGVVQWDLGKAKEGGKFEQKGSLNSPPISLRTALAKLKTENELKGSRIPNYLSDMEEKWPKLAPKYVWSESRIDPSSTMDALNGNDKDQKAMLAVLWEIILSVLQFLLGGRAIHGMNRATEESPKITSANALGSPDEVRVHYGLIASGNQVIKDAEFRDILDQRYGGNVLCVEMEAAGLMNNFPCLVIRGICDYADSQKNKEWQEYCAAIAAAFAKELLQHVQPSDVNGEQPVREIINQVLDDLSAIRKTTANTQAKLDSKEDLEVLNWLTAIDYGPQQSDYFSRRQPETGNWLLESTEFLQWFDTKKQTLFCPGMPGAGKTILSSIVVDFLNSRYGDNTEIGIAYIYCNYQRQENQKVGDLLASILKQLAQCRSSLPLIVKDLYNQHRARRTRPSLEELLQTIGKVVEMYSMIFIVIDALDECRSSDGSGRRLLLEIFNLQKKYDVNFFATSRFISEITKQFEGSLSLEIRASSEDVTRYLEAHIGQLPPSLIQKDTQLQQEIKTNISEAVDGMFLLAELYIGMLADKFTLNDVRDCIKGFQKRDGKSSKDHKEQILSHAYGDVMQRINGQMLGMKTLATRALMWITCAKRQLTTVELQYALAIKIGKSELSEGDLPEIGDVVSVCAGLVTLDKESDVIRLVHYTTQEYLMHTQKKWFPDPESEITAACITYLSFFNFENGQCDTRDELEERLRLNTFYKYAAQNWGYHVVKGETPSQEIIDFLTNKLKVQAVCQVLKTVPKTRIQTYQWYPSFGGFDTTPMTGLHLSSFFGLSEATETLIRLGGDPDLKDASSRTPLWYAAKNGHSAIIELEVGLGADPNIKDVYGWTALHIAAAGGHIKAIKALLATGADDVLTNIGYPIALQIAAEMGHLEVVKLLLPAGMDVNTVVSQAIAWAGEFGLVDLLESRGYFNF